MAKYLMLGKYSPEGLKGMSADRTGQVIEAIQESGGKVDVMYALLGCYDLAFIVDFPANSDAIKSSAAISKITGIGFNTFPAMAIEEFDKLVK